MHFAQNTLAQKSNQTSLNGRKKATITDVKFAIFSFFKGKFGEISPE